MSAAQTLKTDAPLPRGGSGAMFDRIAKRYDLLNRIISLGIDKRWRRATVEALELPRGGRALDHATGTGDLAVAIALARSDVRVVGLDPSPRMLEVGRAKIRRLGLEARIELSEGAAESLPFDDATFDGVSMAFGIRNVVDRPLALREMCRVTKPGGRVAILELSEPRQGLLGWLARFHVHRVVPWLGALLSGAREYRYLQESIEAFPPPEEFGDLMERAGLAVERIVPLTFGVCHLYVGRPRIQLCTPR